MTSFLLKLLAMLTMTIDHAGHYLFDNELWMRMVGRLAFVLYAFMASEGLKLTHDKKRYILQLLTFALVSVIPFTLMTTGFEWVWNHQNVGFTLLIGVFFLYLWEMLLANRNKNSIGAILLALVLCALGAICTHYIGTDYAINGVILIFMFYFWNRQHWSKWMQLVAIITIFFLVSLIKVYDSFKFHLIFPAMFKGIGWVYFGMFLAIIPLGLYNGQKGYSSKWFKTLYWWFYPIHQIIIWVISLFLK